MKTKEEILNEIAKRDSGHTFVDILTSSSPQNLFNDAEVIEASVHEAMEEYSRQECFLFFEFASDYRRIYGMNIRHRFPNGSPSYVISNDAIWESYKKREQLKRYYETEQQ